MWRSFSRSQIAAFLATILDYGILTTWVEVFHFHYVFGVALGSMFGGFTNFFLNRHWSFESNEEIWHTQARRYLLVAAGSLALNTSGVYLITEFFGLYYLLSQVIVSVTVGLLYNYPLQHFFVYKKKEQPHEHPIHLVGASSKN